MNKEAINYLKKVARLVKPSREFLNCSRLELEELVPVPESETSPRISFAYRYSLGIAMAILVLFFSIPAAGLWADNSKPGDLLYPLDRFLEKVRLGLTIQPQKEVLLRTKLWQERVEELKEVSQEAKDQKLKNQENQQIAIVEAEKALKEVGRTEKTTKITSEKKRVINQAVKEAVINEKATIQEIKEQVDSPEVKNQLEVLEKEIEVFSEKDDHPLDNNERSSQSLPSKSVEPSPTTIPESQSPETKINKESVEKNTTPINSSLNISL